MNFACLKRYQEILDYFKESVILYAKQLMINMSNISPLEDIRSVTDLKRHTKNILNQLHATGRPFILTVNGRADSVLLDVKVYEKYLEAGNLARLLRPAEQEALSKIRD